MKIWILISLVVFMGCETRGVVDPKHVERDFPKGWEPFTESMIRKELRPSNLEKIVPDDFRP